MRSDWRKATILLASVALATAAGINAYANRWRFADPDRALQVRPDDSVALTRREDLRQAMIALTPARGAILAEVGRRALRTDPLTAPALRQIAGAESLAGREGASSRLLALSREVTRRDIGTSWMLISIGLDSGDADAILPYFDDALRTHQDAADLLYPALAEALFDPGMRAGLAAYVRDASPWMPNFLRYVLMTGQNQSYAADLIIRAGGLGSSPLNVGIDGRMLSALSQLGQFDQAKAYIRRMPGQNPGVTSDIRLTQQTMDAKLGPFAWSLFDQPDLEALPDSDGNISVRVGRDMRGRVALRQLVLAPGRYRVDQHVSTPSGLAPAKLRWEIVCLPTPQQGAALWSPEELNPSDGRSVTEFVVPADCSAQQLSLIADNGGGGIRGRVVGLALTRL